MVLLRDMRTGYRLLVMSILIIVLSLIPFWWQYLTYNLPVRFGQDAYSYAGLILIALACRLLVMTLIALPLLWILIIRAKPARIDIDLLASICMGIIFGFVLTRWFDLLPVSLYSGGLLPGMKEVIILICAGVLGAFLSIFVGLSCRRFLSG
jgi:hypothetical protein